ncbi:unnamed protein product, partial [Phaeothamnion confervicola]
MASLVTGGPPLLFSVEAAGTYERRRVHGYGHLALPRVPGAYDLLVQTWRPVGTVRQRLQDWHIGGARRLADPSYAGAWPSNSAATATPAGPAAAGDAATGRGTFLSKLGFRTEPAGNVRIRLYVVEQ